MVLYAPRFADDLPGLYLCFAYERGRSGGGVFAAGRPDPGLHIIDVGFRPAGWCVVRVPAARWNQAGKSPLVHQRSLDEFARRRIPLPDHWHRLGLAHVDSDPHGSEQAYRIGDRRHAAARWPIPGILCHPRKQQ